jgi:hypothetical protein
MATATVEGLTEAQRNAYLALQRHGELSTNALYISDSLARRGFRTRTPFVKLVELGLAVEERSGWGQQSMQTFRLKPCDCEAAIEQEKGSGWLRRGTCRNGERVECSGCGRRWVHVCDEAEGCSWAPA